MPFRWQERERERERERRNRRKRKKAFERTRENENLTARPARVLGSAKSSKLREIYFLIAFA